MGQQPPGRSNQFSFPDNQQQQQQPSDFAAFLAANAGGGEKNLKAKMKAEEARRFKMEQEAMTRANDPSLHQQQQQPEQHHEAPPPSHHEARNPQQEQMYAMAQDMLAEQQKMRKKLEEQEAEMARLKAGGPGAHGGGPGLQNATRIPAWLQGGPAARIPGAGTGVVCTYDTLAPPQEFQPVEDSFTPSWLQALRASTEAAEEGQAKPTKTQAERGRDLRAESKFIFPDGRNLVVPADTSEFPTTPPPNHQSHGGPRGPVGNALPAPPNDRSSSPPPIGAPSYRGAEPSTHPNRLSWQAVERER
eukprot:gnl/Hemi2/612_TR218_c0_g1_i1.p1 gnl/Hemi2/612_TR218_c0_g1~~gnl/Hemi2/612_TR218_c0_g1_i1.p1  ORF type:complete len:304 (-),score=92.63 gnl/Hemi2/612_TR218_c0_g1_i1:453-1364(-)